MSEFIKVKLKRHKPVGLVIGRTRSIEEWKAEEREFKVKLSDITSVTHEYDDVYSITFHNSPLTEIDNELFKVTSIDSRLADLI